MCSQGNQMKLCCSIAAVHLQTIRNQIPHEGLNLGDRPINFERNGHGVMDSVLAQTLQNSLEINSQEEFLKCKLEIY